MPAGVFELRAVCIGAFKEGPLCEPVAISTLRTLYVYDPLEPDRSATYKNLLVSSMDLQEWGSTTASTQQTHPSGVSKVSAKE
jgi:hypothetical protein